MARATRPNSSLRVDQRPENVADCFSMRLRRALAEANAAVTMSTVILPSDISSCNCMRVLPVVLAISVNGLNPALTICIRSCPMRRPDADIWANA